MTEKPEIVQLGADVLRRTARPVDDFSDAKFPQLLAVLRDAMLESNGVGIAAPQLGASWRIIIVASRPTVRYPNAPEMPPIVMVNPSFQIVDDSLHKDWEGCLSVPGIRALVPRFRAIQVNYRDEKGREQDLVLEDFPARVFQHEYDHLEGLVYLDRLESNRDIISELEFFKRIAA
ncbi:peptide deformylase [Methylomonas sp. SURF-2]|uniref:Peptide deformylase n=1 Tax=Methylomonas subterranea TaxID=2952225 RepID=A0ABT1TFS0_9GAMM|nr:peptide deformylase [Methylomonas sp. SURF-2]MCQ8103594.1 peptide deformylase [Methylomonas sp. SURF-2]